MKFLKEMKKLEHKRLRELALLCGSAALLVAVAGFVAGGGVGRVAQSVAVNGISPHSLTAAVFPCSWNGSCDNTVTQRYYSLTASTNSISPGQQVQLVYISGLSQNNGASVGYCPTTGDPDYTVLLRTGLTPACTLTGFGQVYTTDASRGGTVFVTPAQTTTYTFCSNVGGQQTGSGCQSTTINVAAVIPAPSVSIDAGAGAGVTRNVTVNTPVTITGTFVAGSGDTISHTSLVDFQTNALPGITTAVPPTTKSYVFTPTAAGSYIFYPSVQTSSYPSWNNYGKSVIVNVTEPVLGPCTDIPTAATLPSGCVNPSPAPGICTPTGGSFSPSTNTCSCPAGESLSGTACVPSSLCSNGLNDSYAPSCTCPAGQYQPLGASSCVALPVCPNGLGSSFSPSCTCPVGQVQSGASCVLQGIIQSFTATPNRVLKGKTATVTWSTAHMSLCTLSSLDSSGTHALSSLLNASVTPTIVSQTVFTLSCSDASGATYPVSQTVNLVPVTVEH